MNKTKKTHLFFKILNKIKMNVSINSALLAIYLFFVWGAYIYLNRSSKAIGLFVFLSLALILSLVVSVKIVTVLKRIEIKNTDTSELKKSKAFFSFFTFTLCILLLWYWAFYPGSFCADAMCQYEQALNGTYNDWYTIVFFTFPLKITGKNCSIVLFQILYFSLMMGYLGMVIYKHSSRKISIIAVAYILLNPYTGWIMVFPIKDVGFSIAACLSMIMLVEAYFSKKWTNKWWRLVLLGIVLANATLFRHNGVLFTFMLIIAMLFILNKKQSIIVIGSFVLFVYVVRIPVYHALNVEKPKERVTEVSGLPLTILENVVNEAPKKLDEETLNFAYSIASEEFWSSYHRCGSFNELKFSGCVNKEVIEKEGILGMLYIAVKCFKVAPEESLEALISLTDMVYSTEYIKGDWPQYIQSNPYNISYTGNISLASILKNYKELVSNTILKYCRMFGIALLFITIVIVGKSNFKSFEDWKKIMICLPIYTYNFGTMFLLTGDDSRFFYITFLVAPLIGVFMLKTEKNVNYHAKLDKKNR